MSGKNFIHCTDKRVRNSEVDGQGILYHGQYVSYFDIGLQEYWRACGLYEAINFNTDPAFHVVHVEVDYLKPCFLDEMISILVRIDLIENSSIKFEFELRGQVDNALKATGCEVHVHVDKTGRPQRISDDIRNMVNAFQS